MLVTINTDASFHHGHKVGGYAYWIVCDAGRITYAGELGKVRSAIDAEMMCMAKALRAVLNSKFKFITRIIINSDAKHSFGLINRYADKGTPAWECWALLDALNQVHGLYKCGDQIQEFRHVKAHVGTAKSRQWVNDWCDRMARIHMREAARKESINEDFNQPYDDNHSH